MTVTVIGLSVTGAVGTAVRVSTVEPPPAGLGLKPAVTPVGKPLIERSIGPDDPFSRWMAIAAVAVEPART